MFRILKKSVALQLHEENWLQTPHIWWDGQSSCWCCSTLKERGTVENHWVIYTRGQLSQQSFLVDMGRQRPRMSEGRSGFVCARVTNHFSVCLEIRGELQVTSPGHSLLCLTQCGVGVCLGLQEGSGPALLQEHPFGEETVNVVPSRIGPAFPQPQTPAAEGGTSPCCLVSSELTAGGTGEFLSSVTMTFHGFLPCILIPCLAGLTPVCKLINGALVCAQVSSEQVRTAM